MRKEHQRCCKLEESLHSVLQKHETAQAAIKSRIESLDREIKTLDIEYRGKRTAAAVASREITDIDDEIEKIRREL